MPRAVLATVVGDYVTISYDNDESARMHKTSFTAPLCKPDFTDIELTDAGLTLRMGEHEFDTQNLYRMYVGE